MARIPGIKTVVCDADDTLWENEPLFREAERRWAGVLSDYGSLEGLSRELYSTEDKNMEDLGYGAKAYMISIMETTLRVTGGKVTGEQMGKILPTLRDIIHNPAVPYPGVAETLETLHSRGEYTLVMFTKGDLLDQEHKVERSGLGKWFHRVKVTSWKSAKEFSALCDELGVEPEEMVSVGNSFKSDIAPMLEIGGWGIYVPSKEIWEHEKAEEFDHPRLKRVSEFREILDYLG